MNDQCPKCAELERLTAEDRNHGVDMHQLASVSRRMRDAARDQIWQCERKEFWKAVMVACAPIQEISVEGAAKFADSMLAAFDKRFPAPKGGAE